MKKTISSLLLLTLLLSISSIMLASCSREKQIPIYRGMSLASSNSVNSTKSAREAADAEYKFALLSDIDMNGGGDLTRGGQYTGDYDGRDAAIDEENPFSDSTSSDRLEGALLDEFTSDPPGAFIPPTTSNDDDFFRFYNVAVHIDNPDNFEIISFSINGEQYTSDMFEKGSTGQTIYFVPPFKTFKIGTNTVVSFSITISDIKFFDGEEIKDVIINGDTEFKKNDASNCLFANLHDVSVGTDSLSFVVNTDSTLSIKYSENDILLNRDVRAILYDGNRIVASRVLPFKGETAVHFDGLDANTLYQILVVGYYKDYDEDEKNIHILYSSAFYTDSAVLFNDIAIAEDYVSFGYLWDEEHQSKEITALKLYMGEACIGEIDPGATSIDGLLAGTTYTLVAEYPGEDATESIYLEFTTFAKSIG